ncbi:unnamed protein product [Adineta ricciae]|uniref:Uncharacterized protein n=1 Tax=Adineta ricciae TaxID=249248 RepID=A0A815QJ92_ADIRI|nr:unnamed protein product [Adineta ricciae]
MNGKYRIFAHLCVDTKRKFRINSLFPRYFITHNRFSFKRTVLVFMQEKIQKAFDLDSIMQWNMSRFFLGKNNIVMYICLMSC